VPDARTVPAAGKAAPDRTLARVVLPAPLRPTRPMRSPSATWKDASASRSRAPARSSMPLATIMITKNTGSHRRLRKPYSHGGEQPGRAFEDGPLRVGDGEEALRGERQVRREPRVVPQLRDRPLVAAEDDRVQPRSAVRRRAGAGSRSFCSRTIAAYSPAFRVSARRVVRWRASCCYHTPGRPASEDGRGRVRCRLERLVGLLLPAAGEALLRPAARRAAPVHQARADLGVGEGRRVTGEHSRRVPAQADQQDADRARRAGVRGEQCGDLTGARGLVEAGGPRRQRKRLRERRMAFRDRAVRRRERDGGFGGGGGRERRGIPVRPGIPVPAGERGDPAGEPLGGDVEPFGIATRGHLHYTLPYRVY